MTPYNSDSYSPSLHMEDFINIHKQRYLMTTSKKVASKASKQLKSKKSTKPEKSVAGSDLAQAKKNKKRK